MRLLRRRAAAVTFDEKTAYARCHGTRDSDVRIVKLPPRRERYDVLAAGEKLRRLFEERLDAREPVEVAEAVAVQSEAGPEEPAPSPPVPPAV